MSEKNIEKILKYASIARKVCIQYDEVYVQAYLREIQRFYTDSLYEIFQQVYVRYTALLYRTGLLLVRTLEFQNTSKRRAEYANYTTVLFNLAYSATDLLREVYQRAYDRDLIDIMVLNLFKAKVQGKPTCSESSVYVESEILKKLSQVCSNVDDGGIEKEDFCNHLVYFKSSKTRLDAAQAGRSVDAVLVEGYLNVWQAFQSRLVNLVFKNFVNFYNEKIVKCMVVFIDQQTQMKLQLLNQLSKLKLDGLKNEPTKIQW